MASTSLSKPCALAAVAVLVACGSSADPPSTAELGEEALAASAPTTRQRAAAATKTANSTTNACAGIRPFYWEVGGTSQSLVSGSVNADNDPTVVTSSTRINLGSASKWIYAAYVVERLGGVLSAADIQALTLQSGYTKLADCYPYQTLGQCFYYQDNELFSPAEVGLFHYDGGHMQHHAVTLGLGPLTRQDFTTEVRSQIGTQVTVSYSLAMPPGGAAAS